MTRHNETKYMAIDQYGNTYHGLTYPRKELAEQIGCHVSTLQKMYVDKADGSVAHVGYATAKMQFRLFKVEPFEEVEEARKVG